MSICCVLLVTASINLYQVRCPMAYPMREPTGRGYLLSAYMRLNDSQEVDAAVASQGEIGRRRMPPSTSATSSTRVPSTAPCTGSLPRLSRPSLRDSKWV